MHVVFYFDSDNNQNYTAQEENEDALCNPVICRKASGKANIIFASIDVRIYYST